MERLRVVLSCFLLFLVLCPLVESHIKHKVIIVGAGASGIAAATRLLENKVDNIIILESEGRIGGRIHSYKVDNVYVDLGAEFCEGEQGNIVYDLVKAYNILKRNEVRYDLVYSNGTIFDDPQLVSDLLNFKNYIQDKVDSDEDNEVSIGEFFLRRYDEDILEKYKHYDDILKVCVDALATLESNILLQEGAFSWLKPSLWRHKLRCPGYQELSWNGAGYRIILDVMMRAFPEPYRILPIDDKIVYKQTVTNIQYGGYNDNKVTVVCEDGTHYIGDFVIFTPSLGVLKHKHQHMFIPELPVRKRSCIGALGFDATMKIVLQFEERWWIGEFTAKAFVWSAEDKVNLAQMFPQGPIKNGESWLSSLKFVVPAVGAPDTIIVYMTGEFIEDIEQASYDTILEGVIFALRKFVANGAPIVNPRQMIYTRWYTNPNFYGTRSFETLGSRTFPFQCNEELAKPITNMNNKPEVLFAGEATSLHHYSTVHGAIESGYREADRILEYYRKYQFHLYNNL